MKTNHRWGPPIPLLFFVGLLLNWLPLAGQTGVGGMARRETPVLAPPSFDKLLPKHGLERKKTSFEMSKMYLEITGSATPMGSYQNIHAEGGILIGGLPFKLNYARGLGSSPFQSTDFFNFSFDNEEFKKKLTEQLKTNDVGWLNDKNELVKKIKEREEERLKQKIAGLKASFEKKYNQQLDMVVKKTDSSVLNPELAKERLRTKQNEYEGFKDKKQAYLNEHSTVASVADSNYKKIQRVIDSYETNAEIVKTIEAAKNNIENNPYIQILKSNKQPEDLIKTSKELSGLDNFLSKFKKFNIGQNVLQGSNFGYNNTVNNGVEIEYATHRLDLGVVYGSNTMKNQFLYNGLQQAQTTEYSRLLGIKIGTQTSDLKETVALQVYEFDGQPKLANNSGLYFPTLMRKEIVATSTTQIQINKTQSVTIDISKSTTIQYNDSLYRNGTELNNVFRLNDGLKNVGLSVLLNGSESGWDYEVQFKKTGLGYSNPGDYNNRPGESSVGLKLGNHFFNDKLSVKYSGQYKWVQQDALSQYSNTRFNNKIQMGYRFNKNYKFNITYAVSDQSMIYVPNSFVKTGTERFSFSSQYRIKYRGINLRNNTSLNYQSIKIPATNLGGSIPTQSTSVQHYTALQFKDIEYSMSVLRSFSSERSYFFSTAAFNVEGGIKYPIGNGLSMQNTLGYYHNIGWNKQLGVASTLSGGLSKHLEMDLQLSLKQAMDYQKSTDYNQVLSVNGFLKYQF